MSDPIAGRNVLVTGGLGFIGSNLVIELVTRGANVVIVDLPAARHGANLFNIEPVCQHVELLDADIRDIDRLAPIVSQQEIIFLLAGQVSHPFSMERPQLDLDVNCTSHLQILEQCRRSNREVRLVYASTRQLYGRPQYLPVDELHPVRPVDVNGVSKFAAEQLFRLYYENYGIRSTSLRLTNVYGPRMDLTNPAKGFIGVFLSRVLQGQPVTIFGNGEQRRDFNYVSDVVSAMTLAAVSDGVWGESWNLAHPRNYSLNDFLEILRQLIEFESAAIEFPPERKAIDVGDYFGSFQRFRQVTGWEPEVDLMRGLENTVSYFRTHLQHYLPDDRPAMQQL